MLVRPVELVQARLPRVEVHAHGLGVGIHGLRFQQRFKLVVFYALIQLAFRTYFVQPELDVVVYRLELTLHEAARNFGLHKLEE